MAAAFKDIDHGWNDIKKQLSKASRAVVRIGVLQDAGMAKERTKDGQVIESADTTMAELAFYNEFGTRRGIPERPFIRTTADEKAKVYAKQLKVEFSDIFAGKSTVKRSLERVGLLAQGHVRKKIKKIKTPPNAPSTIKAKGSSNPLVDTGSLVRSIDFEVKM